MPDEDVDGCARRALYDAGDVVRVLQRQLQDVVDQTQEAVVALKSRIDDLAAVTGSRPAPDPAALDDLLGALYAELQFQDVVGQILNGVNHGLDLMGAELRAVAGYLAGEVSGDGLASDGRLLEALADRYVSNRQRAAHADVPVGYVDDAPAIEFF